MDYDSKSLELCENNKGKLSVNTLVPVKNRDDLSAAYTPGVAAPCREIAADRSKVWKFTIKSHTVAIISDGTAVLGLGDIGPEAAMPVMEGKALLFKEFGGVDAFPICLNTKDPDEIVKTVKYISPAFGGINLEDISAPRCFEIEERLKNELEIPVFHDDQHGTAIIALAGLINALKVVGKKWEDVTILINGAGSAGLSICKLLLKMNPKDIVLVDKAGAICEGEAWMNQAQAEMAKITNKNKQRGLLKDILPGKDVFIGVSAPNIMAKEMVSEMAENSIVFAMANPIPEIMPEEAKKGGARIVASGRSDYPNQINNVLVFPGLFRGALMVEAKKIVDEMKLAAAEAIAELCIDEELNEEYIIPDVFDPRVADAVAERVASIAEKLGIARKPGNRTL